MQVYEVQAFFVNLDKTQQKYWYKS